MKNPFKFVGIAMSAVTKTGELVGKAQATLAAVTADTDGDNIPEYKEAFNGLSKMFQKFQKETAPALKDFWEKFFILGGAATKKHVGEYVEIFKVEVLPNAKSVFEAARQAALAENVQQLEVKDA